jgi:hypothetical protein
MNNTRKFISVHKLIIFFSFLNSGFVSHAQTDSIFWFAAPEVTSAQNITINRFDIPVSLRLTTFGSPATINISLPAIPSMSPIVVNLAANITSSISLTSILDSLENKPANTILNYGLKITASNKISAYYEIESTACGCNPEIFVLKGNNALGNEFWIPSQNLVSNATSILPLTNSSFDIVATENGTTITITPFDSIIGHSPGISFTINLNKGQTYSAKAASNLASHHLNGSRVSSNKPVAITIKDDVLGSDLIYGSCNDLVGDQILPNQLLGQDFIGIKGYLGPPYDKIFVLGTEPNTNVYQNGSFVSTIQPSQNLMLNVGDSSTYIHTNKKVSALQLSGIGCEFGLNVLPPIACTGSNEVAFIRTTSELLYINVLVFVGGQYSFLVNGNPAIIVGSVFQIVPGTNGTWLSGRFSLSLTSYPVGTRIAIANDITPFHLSVIHGGPGSGARFGYFYDFFKIKFNPKILPNDYICPGSSVTLSTESYFQSSYNWTGPNGFTSNSQLPIVSNINVNKAGYYYLEASAHGCPMLKDSVLLTFGKKPKTRCLDSIICVGKSISFLTDSVQGASYFWSGPNGFTSTNQNPMIASSTMNDSGLFVVKISTPQCIFFDTIHVKIFSPIYQNVFAQIKDSIICAGQTLHLKTDSIWGGIYEWSGPSGFHSTERNPIIQNVNLNQAGKYKLSLHTIGCPSVSDSATVSVVSQNYQSVHIQLNDSIFCEGDTIQFTADSIVGGIYRWYGPSGFQSNQRNLILNSVNKNQTGKYTLKANTQGCPIVSDSASVSIFAQNYGSVNAILTDSILCEGDSILLFADSIAGGIYQWSGPSGFHSTERNPIIHNVNVNQAGRYIVSLHTIGCPNVSDSAIVSVSSQNYQSVHIQLNDSIFCEGDTIQFTADSIVAVFTIGMAPWVFSLAKEI